MKKIGIEIIFPSITNNKQAPLNTENDTMERSRNVKINELVQTRQSMIVLKPTIIKHSISFYLNHLDRVQILILYIPKHLMVVPMEVAILDALK